MNRLEETQASFWHVLFTNTGEVDPGIQFKGQRYLSGLKETWLHRRGPIPRSQSSFGIDVSNITPYRGRSLVSDEPTRRCVCILDLLQDSIEGRDKKAVNESMSIISRRVVVVIGARTQDRRFDFAID